MVQHESVGTLFTSFCAIADNPGGKSGKSVDKDSGNRALILAIGAIDCKRMDAYISQVEEYDMYAVGCTGN